MPEECSDWTAYIRTVSKEDTEVFGAAVQDENPDNLILFSSLNG